jgi:hypothetical protein
MSAMPAGRADRRPDWMARKHAGPSSTDREVRQLAEEQLRAGLAAGTPQRLGDGHKAPFEGEADARDHNNFLNDAARRIGLSYFGRLTDPATGRCEFCGPGWRDDKLRCPPSPAGGIDIHWRAWDKSHGRAHVVGHYGPNPDDWHYHRQPGRKRQQPGGPSAGHPFGAGQAPAEPDPPPAGPGWRITPPPARTPRTARSSRSPQQAGEPEGVLAKLRRWAAG